VGERVTLLFVTKSEQSQKIHTTKTDAGSTAQNAEKPRFYRPDKLSRLFGIRNKSRTPDFFAHFSSTMPRAFGIIPPL